jgi:hypothetical protein
MKAAGHITCLQVVGLPRLQADQQITAEGLLNISSLLNTHKVHWHNLLFWNLSVVYFLKKTRPFRNRLCFHLQAKRHAYWWNP